MNTYSLLLRCRVFWPIFVDLGLFLYLLLLLSILVQIWSIIVYLCVDVCRFSSILSLVPTAYLRIVHLIAAYILRKEVFLPFCQILFVLPAVGGGTAGCVLAARLSEIADWKILLVEAGGEQPSKVNIPWFHLWLTDSPLDWKYVTEPQTNAMWAFEQQVVHLHFKPAQCGQWSSDQAYILSNDTLWFLARLKIFFELKSSIIWKRTKIGLNARFSFSKLQSQHLDQNDWSRDRNHTLWTTILLHLHCNLMIMRWCTGCSICIKTSFCFALALPWIFRAKKYHKNGLSIWMECHV